MVEGRDAGAGDDEASAKGGDGRAEPAAFADGDVTPGEGRWGLAEQLPVTDGGDEGVGLFVVDLDAQELARGRGPEDAVDRQAGVPLELAERGRRWRRRRCRRPFRCESRASRAVAGARRRRRRGASASGGTRSGRRGENRPPPGCSRSEDRRRRRPAGPGGAGTPRPRRGWRGRTGPPRRRPSGSRARPAVDGGPPPRRRRRPAGGAAPLREDGADRRPGRRRRPPAAAYR